MALAVARAGAAVKGLDVMAQQVACTADANAAVTQWPSLPYSGGALRLKNVVGNHLEQGAQASRIAQANGPSRLLEL